MVKRMRYFALALSVILFMGTIALTGCSRNPNEQQMTALEEQKKAAVSAEDKTTQLEKENAELKAKLAAKQQELKDAQAEKAKVQSRLGQ